MNYFTSLNDLNKNVPDKSSSMDKRKIWDAKKRTLFEKSSKFEVFFSRIKKIKNNAAHYLYKF